MGFSTYMSRSNKNNLGMRRKQSFFKRKPDTLLDNEKRSTTTKSTSQKNRNPRTLYQKSSYSKILTVIVLTISILVIYNIGKIILDIWVG